MSAGRNDPCPCGSGRKYKKCHLAADTATAAGARTDQTSPFHELDNSLVEEMVRYSSQRFGAEFREVFEALDSYPEMTPQLAGPWLAYVCSMEGRPLVDWYLEEQALSLTRGQREWLEWQRKSWLSIWEVTSVHPGRGLELRDVLTGEVRSVHEVSASRVAEPHLMFLARVVDTSSVSLICGMHPNPLRPMQAQRVVDRVRKILRRKTAVSPDQLRPERVVWGMLLAWSEEVSAAQAMPELVNTDGDPVLLTEERWSFAPARRAEVVQRVATIENADREESDRRDGFTILRAGDRTHKDWDNTVIANVYVDDSTLLTRTNSLRRADAIRAEIERVCGSLVNAGLRTHADPHSAVARSQPRSDPGPHEADPDEQAMMREVKEQHYAQWLDDAIPALGGKTPREAAGTRSGRELLTMMLNELALIESKQPEAARFDVRKLRAALGL